MSWNKYYSIPTNFPTHKLLGFELKSKMSQLSLIVDLIISESCQATKLSKELLPVDKVVTGT